MNDTAKLLLVIILALGGIECYAGLPAVEDVPATPILHVTASDSAGAMPRVTARGGDLYRNETRFRVFGVQNLDHGFERSFYTNGSAELRTRMANGIVAARSIGANTMRIHLQLFDFIGRNARGDLFARQDSFDNLAFLQSTAEREGIYLLVSGNNAWSPSEVPAWYDEMSYRDRWEVQAFFFEHLAAAGAGSPSILAYELMSEPTIRFDEQSDWYFGELGGYWFAQSIANGIPQGQAKQVARDWINRLTSAIREHDPVHLITIGVNANFTGGAFGIENTAPLLDILSPHIYPRTADPEYGVRLAQRFALSGKPVVIGETHLFASNEQIYRDFLVASAPLVDGFISFFDGKGPDDMSIDEADPQAGVLRIHRANLTVLRDMRGTILGQ